MFFANLHPHDFIGIWFILSLCVFIVGERKSDSLNHEQDMANWLQYWRLSEKLVNKDKGSSAQTDMEY